uniref:Putative secreted protein n=1 Tax=Anopheles triannulatus TaxID=58253 RepID=A0A2M4B316_9DIPT
MIANCSAVALCLLLLLDRFDHCCGCGCWSPQFRDDHVCRSRVILVRRVGGAHTGSFASPRGGAFRALSSRTNRNMILY